MMFGFFICAVLICWVADVAQSAIVAGLDRRRTRKAQES